MRSNWRDCAAWHSEKLPMNTSSNEACKLYDVCLSQFTGYYEEKQFGGLANSLNQMINSDPNFILGHCLKNGIELLGTNSAFYSNTLSDNINNLIKTSELLSNEITQREKFHVKAIEYLHKGDLVESIKIWEDILIDHPTDMMAIRMLASGYFYTGNSIEMRDSIARVLPKWNTNTPLYNYLYGFYAFGLSQTKELEKAEKYARKGIELNHLDGWACHTIAHINEYRSTFNEGINFLLKTENDWQTCEFIRGHNYWHLCLFYLENQEYEKIIDILDNNPSFSKPQMTIDLVNSSSLLFRLKLDGFKDSGYLDTKFKELKNVFNDRLIQHGYIYSDSHMAMIYAMCGTDKEKKVYLDSLQDFISDTNFSKFIRKLNLKISGKLYEALFSYGEGNFSKTVDLLYPIRYDLFKIGGSNAQRDIFNLILIDACFRSESKRHNTIGQGLYFERLAQRENSSLTKRLGDRYFINEFYENL
ncbi:unnamed protein product [Brachionus calyciflorus]|uniref:Tetratricopeptide repeat protein 38 n=1 Tax=Brachionus calyciflorus TaxID=104777 RepID=A0A813TVY6_9BILA|nr:unnamed protein product [Brachionus calyciflorus]